MFSSGQLIFATLFVLGFVAVMVFTYSKDKKLHKKNYQGVKWVLLSFAFFIIFLFLIKYFLKN